MSGKTIRRYWGFPRCEALGTRLKTVSGKPVATGFQSRDRNHHSRKPIGCRLAAPDRQRLALLAGTASRAQDVSVTREQDGEPRGRQGYRPRRRVSNPASDAAASILGIGAPYLLPMRSLEVIIAGVNRSDGGPQPMQLRAALRWRVSVCFPEDPEIVLAKVNRFGFVGTSVKRSVHHALNSWLTTQWPEPANASAYSRRRSRSSSTTRMRWGEFAGMAVVRRLGLRLARFVCLSCHDNHRLGNHAG